MPVPANIAKLWRAQQGSVAIIFSASVFLVAMSVGLAIDGARTYGVANHLEAALDSAALAGGKMLDDDNISDEDISQRVKAYLNAHIQSQPSEGVTLSLPTIDIDRQKGVVAVSVKAAVATTFGKIAGIPSIDFDKSASIVYIAKRIELAMVVDVTGSMNSSGKIDALKSAAREVVDTLLSGNPSPGTIRIGLAPYSAAVNVGPYASTVSGGASVDGCVFERDGSTAYTEAPPSSQPLAAMANPAAPSNPNYGCPAATLLPLTDDRNLLRATIDSYSASGWTAGHIGAAWGWYLLSSQWSGVWPAASMPRSYSDPKVIKSVLFMTDGEFNTSYNNGNMNATGEGVPGSSAYQALQLCQNMKAQNIVIYSVAFQSPPEAESVLRQCATSPGHFFIAGGNAELRAAFRQIADRIGALRLSR
ncbi:MAG TPA: pilus assembly protein TadG-related protein [Hyphomicrobiaceae bacterium]|nr:pilus assembly protein TadG-related protein [Hyphomicrobiaceae bacterium]